MFELLNFNIINPTINLLQYFMFYFIYILEFVIISLWEKLCYWLPDFRKNKRSISYMECIKFGSWFFKIIFTTKLSSEAKVLIVFLKLVTKTTNSRGTKKSKL